jgi:hypothetical protein
MLPAAIERPQRFERVHDLGKSESVGVRMGPASDLRGIGRDLALGAVENRSVGEDQAA